ncbi:hypothetical protein [Fimbriiglobus ruber]|uniref:Uncharacterized protein n=1 Tax=Fimbriiglobus ruber TaxID=1908690 RepID=A0A225E4Y4_9BACT|nr:hypothetical protein [Fimbriiglobus ruber]OWK46814.1 hypothetical protein FRUB_00513 [Fimbriiglobus ruber]
MEGQQIFYLCCIGVAAVVAFVAIPILSHYWYAHRIAEQNAVLKQQMIERGFTADEIVRVIAAGTGDSDPSSVSHGTAARAG